MSSKVGSALHEHKVTSYQADCGGEDQLKRKRRLSSRFEGFVLDSSLSSISTLDTSASEPLPKKPRIALGEIDHKKKRSVKISGGEMLNFFENQGLVYSALPVTKNPEVKKEFSPIWHQNRHRYDYDFDSREVKRIVHCIEHLKDDASDEYASSVEIRYIDPKWNFGLFANRQFSKNEVIGVYSGEFNFVFSKKALKEGREKGLDLAEYLFEFPDTPFDQFGIDGAMISNYTRYINHAEPKSANVSTAEFFYKGRCYVVFIADRNIPKGEQFFYDYGPTYWEEKKQNPS